MPAFERVTRLPGVDPARAWRVLGASFPRLVPPWETLEILGSPASIRVGEIASFRQPVGPLRIPWSSTITEVEPGVGFVDVASRSPFRAWRHEHAVQDGGGAILGDRVVWEARPGLGALDGWVRSRMELLFAWRHRVLREDLALLPPMRLSEVET
ncbi:MAG TPA: hypothetical protein PKA64_23385, partial [Myxococcota bacterium]|nr:hypothetical protein [Myxococcota bacterium]